MLAEITLLYNLLTGAPVLVTTSTAVKIAMNEYQEQQEVKEQFLEESKYSQGNLLGLHEVKDNKKLSKLLHLDPSKTAWCAAFVNALEIHQGREGTGSLMARSYLTYGTKVLGEPRKGDIVVLWRVKREGPYGHVGYVEKVDDNYVYIYGGNQSNKVSIKKYPIGMVLDFRRVE